jgi:transposase InsO family protein
MLERYKQEKHKPVKKRRLFTFIFDGFYNYKSAWSILFYRVTKCIAGVPIANKKYGLKHNNNSIENYNGGLKNRLIVMRGGFRSWGGAEAFLDLKRIIYNFVNPQEKLNGKTPAEAAEIKLKLGRNRLLGLIRLASMISR